MSFFLLTISGEDAPYDPDDSSFSPAASESSRLASLTRFAGTTVALGSYLEDDLALLEDGLLFLPLLDLARSGGAALDAIFRGGCTMEFRLLPEVPTEGTFLGLWWLES